ncbi:MAG: extracellular solute-binding protein [Mycobacteriales bacterium]
MTAHLTLRGLCWDHPRCTAPMAAAAREWHRRTGTALTWDARPLAAFNDQPIADAVAGYDLVFVDHPAIAEAAGTGCLAPLDTLLPGGDLDALAADSIAGSHGTYAATGHQWAVAVDAACQVAVLDPASGESPPSTWAEALDLAKRAPVAVPLYPSDAIIALVSIAVGLARAATATTATRAATAAGPAGAGGDPGDPAGLFTEEAAALLTELVGRADPRSFDLNPPGLLELMARGASPPVYAPLLFGYSDYQRPTATGRRLRFHDAPTPDGRPGGTVLGGAGLAVPAASAHPEAAAAFAGWVAGAPAQREIVCVHGGQPASRATWADPSADELTGGFLSGTVASMTAAYVRPRTTWWPRFQEAAGERLVPLLRTGGSAAAIHRTLIRTLEEYS